MEYRVLKCSLYNRTNNSEPEPGFCGIPCSGNMNKKNPMFGIELKVLGCKSPAHPVLRLLSKQKYRWDPLRAWLIGAHQARTHPTKQFLRHVWAGYFVTYKHQINIESEHCGLYRIRVLTFFQSNKKCSYGKMCFPMPDTHYYLSTNLPRE